MDLKMLKGMTLDDLLDVDYSKLTEEEIAYVEKRLVRFNLTFEIIREREKRIHKL